MAQSFDEYFRQIDVNLYEVKWYDWTNKERISKVSAQSRVSPRQAEVILDKARGSLARAKYYGKLNIPFQQDGRSIKYLVKDLLDNKFKKQAEE